MKRLFAAMLTLGAALALLPAAALAQTIVSGDLVSARGTVTVPADMVLQGDLKVMSGEAVVLGRVEGDVEIISGQAEVAGRVTGDVKLVSGDVRLSETAVVNGRVVVLSGGVAEAPGARVDGGVVRGGILGARAEVMGGEWVVDDDGVRGPGIYIGSEGVRLPGVRVDDGQVLVVADDVGQAVASAMSAVEPVVRMGGGIAVWMVQMAVAAAFLVLIIIAAVLVAVVSRRPAPQAPGPPQG